MIYIGIDIAKQKHFASAIDSDGKVLVAAFPFFNSAKGFAFLMDKLKDLDLSNSLFGFESTGHYAENLTIFLSNKGFDIGVINPIQTNAIRKANIRKTKTDKIDTKLISECLKLGHFTRYTKKDVKLLELKSLTRFRHKLIQSRTKLKIQLVSCMDQLFPELTTIFNKIHSKGCYAVLSSYSTPKEISKVRLNTLTKILSSASKGSFKEETALALKEATKNSIGIDNVGLSIQVKFLISQIALLDTQIKDIDSYIKTYMDDLNSPIMSIPGIGYILGAVILSEIGNIAKFSHPNKLLAFAGLDPSVIQSGNFNAATTKISKRGSSYLRYAIRTAAGIIIWNNDTFKQYYQHKLSQGKRHGNAIGHVSFKLTKVIFKILTDNVNFDLK